jgi:hypothetical protein
VSLAASAACPYAFETVGIANALLQIRMVRLFTCRAIPGAAGRIPAKSLIQLLTKEIIMKVNTNVKAGLAGYYYYSSN